MSDVYQGGWKEKEEEKKKKKKKKKKRKCDANDHT
jgi:hypothetical protein